MKHSKPLADPAPMKKYFLTFGDSRNYRASLDRIAQEAADMGFFDDRRICSEKDISEFMAAHDEFFARSRTGFGYWTWKPYLVSQQLEAMAEGDILLYCDSGCQFNVNDASMARLQEYFDMLAGSPYSTLSFELGHKEKTWTKGDCFEHFSASMDDSFQLVGGVFLIRKCAAALELIASINDLISRRQYHLFDDTPSVAPNDPTFIEHRHDQSVFSLKRKQAGTLVLADETWFKEWEFGRDYPIHARRFR